MPLAWRVEETAGAIGFATQKELRGVVAGWRPAGQTVILLADRFYGTPAMIRWCRERGWDYRRRLKGNRLARRGARKTTTGALALCGGPYFEAVALTGHRVITTIGIIRDPGHGEPWIIAMAAKPGYRTTLGYSARWGIKPLFSDFKSRGFGLEQTHLRYPDRLAS
ncbi:MAG: transposase [Stellaceae bacterium]